MALGYTTIARIQQRSGLTLSASQQAEATELIEAAELFIDQYTGRSWVYTNTLQEERFTPVGRLVHLSRYPVASVSQVRVRSTYPGSEYTTLEIDVDYELLDASNGILALRSPIRIGSSYVYVTYTPVAASVPDPRLELAATDLVLYWLLPTTNPGLGGVGAGGDIKSFSVGGDLSVTFRDGTGQTRFVPAAIVLALDLLLQGRKTYFA